MGTSAKKGSQKPKLTGQLVRCVLDWAVDGGNAVTEDDAYDELLGKIRDRCGEQTWKYIMILPCKNDLECLTRLGPFN